MSTAPAIVGIVLEQTSPDRVTHVLLRVGAAYVLQFARRFSVAPSVSFDFVREDHDWGHAVVFGVGFGVAF